MAEDLGGLKLARLGVSRIGGVDEGGDVGRSSNRKAVGDLEIVIDGKELGGQEGVDNDGLPRGDPSEQGSHPQGESIPIDILEFGNVGKLEGYGEANDVSRGATVRDVIEAGRGILLADGDFGAGVGRRQVAGKREKSLQGSDLGLEKSTVLTVMTSESGLMMKRLIFSS